MQCPGQAACGGSGPATPGQRSILAMAVSRSLLFAVTRSALAPPVWSSRQLLPVPDGVAGFAGLLRGDGEPRDQVDVFWLDREPLGLGFGGRKAEFVNQLDEPVGLVPVGEGVVAHDGADDGGDPGCLPA